MPQKVVELDEQQERLVLDLYDRAFEIHKWYWERLHRWRRAVLEAARFARDVFEQKELEGFAKGEWPPWIDGSGIEAVPREQAETFTRAVLDCVVDCAKLAPRVEQAVKPFGGWAGAPSASSDKPGPPPEHPELIVAFVATLAGLKLDSVQRVIDHKRKPDVRQPGHLAKQFRRAAGGKPLQKIVANQAGIDAADFDKALAETFEFEFEYVELEPGEELEIVAADVPPVPPHLVRALAKQLGRPEEEVQLAIAIARTRKGQ